MSFQYKWKHGLKGARSVTQRCPVIAGKTVLATFNHGQGKKSFKFEQLWSLELFCAVKVRMLKDGSHLLAIAESGDLVTIDTKNGEILNKEKLAWFKEGYGMVMYESDFVLSDSKECVRLARKI